MLIYIRIESDIKEIIIPEKIAPVTLMLCGRHIEKDDGIYKYIGMADGIPYYVSRKRIPRY